MVPMVQICLPKIECETPTFLSFLCLWDAVIWLSSANQMHMLERGLCAEAGGVQGPHSAGTDGREAAWFWSHQKQLLPVLPALLWGSGACFCKLIPELLSLILPGTPTFLMLNILPSHFFLLTCHRPLHGFYDELSVNKQTNKQHCNIPIPGRILHKNQTFYK